MQVELKNKNLQDLLEKKGHLINQGRSISEEIENLEKEMQAIDTELVEAEKLVDISDLDADAKDLTERFNALKEEMDVLNKKVATRLSENAPKELTDKYHTMKKMLDTLEQDRNKVAIKAQKYNDKIIPMVRTLLKPHLKDEFDDFGSVQVEGGVIKGEIFSHLEEWKEAFRKKKA